MRIHLTPVLFAVSLILPSFAAPSLLPRAEKGSELQGSASEPTGQIVQSVDLPTKTSKLRVQPTSAAHAKKLERNRIASAKYKEKKQAESIENYKQTRKGYDQRYWANKKPARQNAVASGSQRAASSEGVGPSMALPPSGLPSESGGGGLDPPPARQAAIPLRSASGEVEAPPRSTYRLISLPTDSLPAAPEQAP